MEKTADATFLRGFDELSDADPLDEAMEASARTCVAPTAAESTASATSIRAAFAYIYIVGLQ
eukprot:scaffold14472_cov115-Isochrysis_galbana.AAC.1